MRGIGSVMVIALITLIIFPPAVLPVLLICGLLASD